MKNYHIKYLLIKNIIYITNNCFFKNLLSDKTSMIIIGPIIITDTRTTVSKLYRMIRIFYKHHTFLMYKRLRLIKMVKKGMIEYYIRQGNNFINGFLYQFYYNDYEQMVDCYNKDGSAMAHVFMAYYYDMCYNKSDNLVLSHLNHAIKLNDATAMLNYVLYVPAKQHIARQMIKQHKALLIGAIGLDNNIKKMIRIYYNICYSIEKIKTMHEGSKLNMISCINIIIINLRTPEFNYGMMSNEYMRIIMHHRKFLLGLLQ